MNVENDTEHHRFLVRLPDGEGELIYKQIAPRMLDLIHTKVAPALHGHRVAEALAETAFAFARKHGLHIVATCPYVQSWLTKHPEQKDLVISRADADSRFMPTELLFRSDAYLENARAQVIAVHERGIELDRTIFYPMGGGQAGDTGALVRANGERIAIADTRKGDAIDGVLHVAAPSMAQPELGETLTLEIDWQRRYALMRLHTALHVMSCVVVAPVTGGNISADKARLDFDIDMSLLDAEKIERETNALIARGVETETVWITDEELDARPELVKTMSVQPPRGAGRVRLLRIPGIDLQPCGGTHVKNIAEIGAIRVLKIRSEGRRNKRVEIALAG